MPSLSEKQELLKTAKKLLDKSEMHLRIAAELMGKAGHQLYPLNCNADKVDYVAETIKSLSANMPHPINHNH